MVRFATTHPSAAPVVAEVGRRHRRDRGRHGERGGRLGGTIWVAPSQRGRGLGRALTQVVIDALEAAGCVTLVLVSTEPGLPLYDRWASRSRAGTGSSRRRPRRAAPELSSGPSSRRPAASWPWTRRRPARIAATPSAGSRRPRARVIAARRRSVASSSEPLGGGATIAPDPETRCACFRPGVRLRDGRVRVGLLDDNAAGLIRLEAAGLHPIWSAPGSSVASRSTWHPEWIWGQLNHAIGYPGVVGLDQVLSLMPPPGSWRLSARRSMLGGPARPSPTHLRGLADRAS